MTTRMRSLVLGFAAVALVTASSASARTPCPLRRSCTRPLFRCFVPKGACQSDAQAAGTTVCWANGVSVDQQFGTGGRITVLGRRARPCTVGTTQRGPNGEFQVSWTRKNKTWVFTANPDGSKSFTCPSGKVETYSATDFRDGQACGRIPSISSPAAAACVPGACS